MKESDLFAPIKAYFEAKGYSIYAEVKNCDIVAIKDDELIIIETKLNFNISLIFQALDRQKITDKVYMAFLHPKKRRNNLKKASHIAEKLEIGVLTVDFSCKPPQVYEILEPLKTAPRNNIRKRAVIEEIKGREVEDNIGGANRRKINTAYRQKAIKIARILSEIGSSSAKILRKEHNCPDNTREILYNNHYEWFRRAERGIYTLSERGKEEMEKCFVLNAVKK